MSSPMISADELAHMVSDGSQVVVLHIVWDDLPASVSAPDVPGTVRVDLARELASPPIAGGGRMPLPQPADLTARFAVWGIHPRTPVVVADDVDGRVAARAWWVLSHAGLVEVRVLDGGLAAWRALGGESLPEVEPGAGTAVARFGAMATLDAAGAAARSRDGVLLDARALERYIGYSEPLDARAGHIPGAISTPAAGVFDHGRLRSAAELAAHFATVGVTPGTSVGVYCGSGVAASLDILALRVAGIDAALYVGSWSEWAARDELPIATGSSPA